MNEPTPSRASKSGGFLLAVSIIVGVIAGSVLRQPSIGFLAGLGVGLVLLAAVYVIDRRR